MMRYLWTWRVLATVVGGVVCAQAGCMMDAEGTGSAVLDGGVGGFGGQDASAGSGGQASTGGAAGGGASGFGGTSGTGGVAGSAGDAGSGGAGGSGAAGEAGQAGAAGGGTGGGTGGSAGFEQCDDGVDNDGDGDADCADDECQALRYACTPPVPPDWIGYFRVRVSANAEPAPMGAPCPSGSMPERYFSGKAGPAACNGCSCGPLDGAVCGAPGLSCDFGSKNCANVAPVPQLGDFGCHDMSGGDVSCFLNGNNPLLEAGSCVPIPDVPEFTNKLPFSDIVDTCYFDNTSDAAGCDGQDPCIPPGAGEYAGALCVMKADDQTVCPPRWDAKAPLRLYKEEDVVDSRACEPCTCAPDLAGMQCVGGAVEVWDLDDCNDCDLFCDGETEVNSGTCKDLSKWADSDTMSMKVKRRTVLENGKCVSEGGTPTGLVETKKGVTFCCLSM